jgi:hypothetical protein
MCLRVGEDVLPQEVERTPNARPVGFAYLQLRAEDLHVEASLRDLAGDDVSDPVHS